MLPDQKEKTKHTHVSHFGGSWGTNYFVNYFFSKKETCTKKKTKKKTKHPQSRMTLMLIARHLIWQSVWMSQHRPRRLIDGWCLKNAVWEHHGEERSATKQITSRALWLVFPPKEGLIGIKKICFKRHRQHQHWGTEWQRHLLIEILNVKVPVRIEQKLTV